MGKLEKELPTVEGYYHKEFLGNLVAKYKASVNSEDQNNDNLSSNITLDGLVGELIAEGKDVASLDFFSSAASAEAKLKQSIGSIEGVYGVTMDSVGLSSAYGPWRLPSLGALGRIAALDAAAAELAAGAAAAGGLALATGVVGGVAYAHYAAGQAYEKDLNYYSNLATNSNLVVTPGAEDYALANPYGLFSPTNPHDLEAFEHIARGVAIDRKLKELAATSAAQAGARANAGSAAIAATESDDGNSGLCKVPRLYSPDDEIFTNKEPWMSQGHKLSATQKPMLQGVEIYGLNPAQVVPYKNGGIRVHTELPGGDAGAKECFKNLTGKNVTGNIDEGFSKDGSKVVYRLKDNFAKIEINGFNYEKITFSLNF